MKMPATKAGTVKTSQPFYPERIATLGRQGATPWRQVLPQTARSAHLMLNQSGCGGWAGSTNATKMGGYQSVSL